MTSMKKTNDELIRELGNARKLIKEKEKELKAESARKYETIRDQSRTLDAFFDNTITPLAILDRDFNFIMVNHAYARAGKRDISEFESKNLFDLYPSNAKEIFIDVVATKTPYQALARPFGFPGQSEEVTTYWDWTLVPIMDRDSEVDFLVFSLVEVTERKRAELELTRSHTLLCALGEAQASYISDTEPNDLFDKLLSELLKITGSEYGFIGQVLKNNKDEPYLKNFATTNIAWNKETKEFYEKYKDEGLEFYNMESLFGLVITSGAPVISNDPSTDKRGCGIPEGHPPLKAFLGLPCYVKDKLVGMVAIANRPGGYNEEVIELLGPLLSTTANIIEAYRKDVLRRETEEALKETEERFKKAQEIANVGTWEWEPDSGEILWTDEMFKILGYAPNEVKPTYELFFERVHPDDKERLQEAVTGALENKNPLNLDYKIIRKDGSIIDTYTQGDVHFDAEGRPVRMLGLLQDITERKRAGKALEESERLLSIAQEIAHLGHWKLDPATNEVTGSNELYRIFGLERESSTFESFIEMVHPDDREFDISTITRGIEQGEDWDIEHRLRLKDGTEKTVHAIGNAITDETGKTIQLIGTVQDISQNKKIEADRLKMQKLESIGVLAGGIAHDFNNLLTGILGNISLSMMELDQNEKAYKRLKEAEKASFFARDLTQQLLTFSKGGAPVMETLPIEEVIREPAEFALRGSDKSLLFEFTDSLAFIDADKGQIGQVINNLVINAEQAMVEGGIIKISVGKKTIDTSDHLPVNNGDYILIKVSDTGTGILPEHISKVFDPYFTTKEKGSGLGLASVYSIIKNHSGHIDLTSEVNKGTTFHIYLPVSKTMAARISKKEEKIIKGHGRVLIMDDEEIIRELLGEFLTQLGYETMSASDGLKAVKIYKEAKENGRPFKAVIMDLTIQGGLGGKETIKLLLEEDPEVKGIVSSGYSNDPVIANYREYGFSGYLNKPYKVPMLSRVLDEVIKGGKA